MRTGRATDEGPQAPGPAAEAGVPWVSASEIGAVAYCARAYRLQQVERVALAQEVAARLDRGVRAHAAHGARYARQQALAMWGGIALVCAAALGALAWVLARLGL